MSWRKARLNLARWARVRKAVFEKAGHRCEKCGKGAGTLECDHIKPYRLGGLGGDPWALDNLQALCRSCHIVKTAGENSKGQFDERSWAILQASRRDWKAFRDELRGGANV